MNHLVEILLIVGILINLIKGADLLLRPHQQKWLQDKLETITLWFNYKKPLTWFKYISNPIVFSGLAVFIGSPFAYALLHPLFQVNQSFNIPLFFGFLILSSFQIKRADRIGSYCINHISGKAEREENKPYNFLTFIKRFFQETISLLVLCLFGIPIYFLTKVFLHFIQNENFSFDFTLFRISFVPCWPYIFELLALFAIGLIVIIATGLLFLMEVLLIFIRALCWRIVEYNKGAFAAIVLIITVSLGELHP